MGSDDYDDNDEREKQRLIDHVEKNRFAKRSWVIQDPKRILSNGFLKYDNTCCCVVQK